MRGLSSNRQPRSIIEFDSCLNDETSNHKSNNGNNKSSTNKKASSYNDSMTSNVSNKEEE